MEPKININIFHLISSISLFMLSSSCSIITNPSPSKIVAVFAFGDSTIDTGNNNYLNTTSRSNRPPYGRDFPFSIATGRFSNGKLPIDFIIENLGLKKLLPPYLKPQVTVFELLTGVSFGSASAGFDNLTSQSANVLTVADQIKLFDEALVRIRRLVGEERAKFIVKNALFFFSIGTNDITNYYDVGQRANEFNISGYQDFILQKYEEAIRTLYFKGARKFTATSLSSVGCLPLQITINNITNPRRCVEQQSMDTMAYNVKLQQLITKLESQLQGVRIAYYDVYDTLLDLINNPAKYGFEETLKGCCGTGLFEFGPTCTPTTPTCPDASKFVFWDAVHPSLASYKILADLAIRTVIPYVTS